MHGQGRERGMLALDTRLPWEAIESLATGQAATRKADPPGLTTEPRVRLLSYLDTWAGMDEAKWTEASVKALYDDIMDIFHDHPREADGWFREWRAAHPTARLA